MDLVSRVVRPFGVRATRVILCLVAGLTLATGSVDAQTGFGPTRFTWPDTSVDVSSYLLVDQCLAATLRVSNAIKDRGWQRVWSDTMPRDPHEPPLALVTSAAQRCGERFDPRNASLRDFALLTKLYLEAGRDSAAVVLLARRLDGLGPKREAEREAAMDTAFQAYLKAKPIRLAAAASLLRRWPAADRVGRLTESILLTIAYYVAGDTAQMRTVGVATFALADSLTLAERASRPFVTMAGLGGPRLLQMMAAFAIRNSATALDSLRRGTAAYVRYVHEQAERVAKIVGPSRDDFIGQKAPAIIADYWLPSEMATSPLPTQGRVALVTFLSHGDCLQGSQAGMIEDGVPAVPSRCFKLAATLHRLAQRFPTLQIVTITRTHGYFTYLNAVAPNDEGDLIKRELAAFQLPGAVAITSAQFERLPAPDERRVDKPDQNVVHYGFGQSQSPAESPFGEFYLIDQDGIIVYADDDAWGDASLAGIIDVLVHRKGE